MIKSIEIQNIKGIGSGDKSKLFELDIIPNKPSLIVAPNGFGKSSLATAFKKMNQNRIKLEKSDCYQEDETNFPLLKIKFKSSNQAEIILEANNNSNSISNHFDYYVINNAIKAKGIGQSFGGRVNVSASLNIDPIILIDSIPENVDLNYSYSNEKHEFGDNNKILLNLNDVLLSKKLMNEWNTRENLTILDRTENKKVQTKISSFKEKINQLPSSSSKKTLINWIRDNELQSLSETNYLKNLADIIKGFDLPFPKDKEIDSYIYAMGLIKLYHSNKESFKSFCKLKEYELLKESYTDLFNRLNSTWLSFKPKKDGNSLILEFPKTHLISNGQRDVLCFIANLEKAKHKLKKQNCILIIDEIFDYLDDANLIAVQYYTTMFIEEFKAQNRFIYPLILTHLDPLYFKGHVFGRKHKIKTYYLVKSDASVNEHLIKVLKERNKETSPLKGDIEKYLLHYHTTKINQRQAFQDLGLKVTWGEGDNFDNYIFQELEKYINSQSANSAFDPLAVCCAVRKKIEQNVYEQIIQEEYKDHFLNIMVSGTSEKLDYAESIGISVNESYYFLGIIYNEALHWKDDRDKNSNIAPAMGKLQNLTIKKLIESVFS